EIVARDDFGRAAGLGDALDRGGRARLIGPVEVGGVDGEGPRIVHARGKAGHLLRTIASAAGGAAVPRRASAAGAVAGGAAGGTAGGTAAGAVAVAGSRAISVAISGRPDRDRRRAGAAASDRRCDDRDREERGVPAHAESLCKRPAVAPSRLTRGRSSRSPRRARRAARPRSTSRSPAANGRRTVRPRLRRGA